MKDEAVLLCRISNEKQEDGFSLAAQEKHGKEYCASKGFEIVKIFSFTETASKKDKRKNFKEAINFIRKKSSKMKVPLHLVAEKPDRISREFSSIEDIQLLVMMGKVVVHYHKDRRILDSKCSPADIFNDDMQTALSKYQANNIKREVNKGMEEKASTGWFPSRPPYGYVNFTETTETGQQKGASVIIVDPNKDMVKLVQRVYELKATMNLSYDEIFKRVREERLIPIGKTFSRSGVEKMLKNKFYGGTFDWQGIEYNGKHDIIVPQEYFRIVHGHQSRGYARRQASLFTGWLRCADPECNCHIIYDSKTKKLASTLEIKTYRYYRCSDGKKIHKLNGEKQRNILERNLLELFSRPVSEISITEEVAQAVSKELKRTHDKAVMAHKRNMEGYRTAIVETEKEEDRAYELMAGGVIDKEIYQRQISSIRTKKRKFEDLLEHGNSLINSKFYETAEFIIELAKNAELLWKSRTDEDKLMFLKMILSNQTLKVNGANFESITIEYDLKEPFKKLAEIKKAIPKDGSIINWYSQGDSNPCYRREKAMS